MKTALRRKALELGFDACRITSAAPPDHAAKFQQWLAARAHGEMAYLERNAFKRVDPQQVLGAARSVITLAASYATPDELGGTARACEPSRRGQRSEEDRSPRPPPANVPDRSASPPSHGPAGVVARYARSADYHDVLAGPLKDLTAFVNHLGGPDTRSLWYVDTGPLLERDLAQRAGLGFIGKHTNLISRELGNWFFLSEIITTLALEPDPPEKNRCGSCVRCLEACPTRALTAPFQLDARRCISYLTIELKGSIPLEFREAIGARIFGCDDCLEVCPWNRFAREARLMKSQERTDLSGPDLLALLALDEAGFKQRFAGTPVLRIKRRGLLRNVCVALGNVGDASARPALTRAASDPEPLIAEHARWAIDRLAVREGQSS